MRSFDEDGVSRLYNANGRVKIDGVGMYRPAGGQNVWLQHDTGEVELRANGETIAMFDSPEAVFEDADAYPATEKDISDFSEWSEIERPAFPPDRDMVDVITVTDAGLLVLEDNEEIPIDELGEDTEDTPERSSGPSPPTF